ncbi:hypothetical protein NQ317_018881, partial [Molorchus minor]
MKNELKAFSSLRPKICRAFQELLPFEDSLDELMLQLGADSQGKLDRWEWDSGARDMSPVPKSIVKNSETFTKEEFK